MVAGPDRFRPTPTWRLARVSKDATITGDLEIRGPSCPAVPQGVRSEADGPLDGQAAALVIRGSGIVPFFVTPSGVKAGTTSKVLGGNVPLGPSATPEGVDRDNRALSGCAVCGVVAVGGGSVGGGRDQRRRG